MDGIRRRKPVIGFGRTIIWMWVVAILWPCGSLLAEEPPLDAVDEATVEPEATSPASLENPDSPAEEPADEAEAAPDDVVEDEQDSESEQEPLEALPPVVEVADSPVLPPGEPVDTQAVIAVERIDGLNATKNWRRKATGAVLRRVGREGYRRVLPPKELQEALAGTEEEGATPCFRLDCATRKASLAGADYLLQGDILTSDGRHTLHLKLVDVIGENVVREATDWVEEMDEADLPKLAAEVAVDLLKGRVASLDTAAEVADYSDYNEKPAYDITKWTTLGVGLAGIGAAVALGILAAQKQDDYNDTWKTSRKIDSSLKDEADSLAMGANIAYGVGGAILATSVTMFLIDGFNVGEYKPNPVRVGAWVAPGTVKATVRYEF